MMAQGKLKRSNSAVMPVESSPKHSNFSTAATIKAHSSSSFDPETPVVSVLVQGRFDGPVERYRVASRQMCCASKTLGWAAVVVGAAEIAVGVVVFSQWMREGGWWAGLLGILSGIAGTGITADTPVGTSLVSWLVALSFLSFLTSLVTLISLDGARWLDTKDIEACAPSFDNVCPPSHCTCTTSDQLWDRCFDFGAPQSASDCDDLESTSSSLLASSLALLLLTVISTLLFALGVKCKYLGGGVERGGRGGSGGEAKQDPAAKAVPEGY